MKITLHDKPKYRSVFEDGALAHYVNGKFYSHTQGPPARNKAGVYVVKLHNGEYRINEFEKSIRPRSYPDGFRELQFVPDSNIVSGVVWQEGERVSGSIGQIYLNLEDGVYEIFIARTDRVRGGLTLKRAGSRMSMKEKFRSLKFVAVVSGTDRKTDEERITFTPLISTETFEEAFEAVQDEVFITHNQQTKKDIEIDIIRIG